VNPLIKVMNMVSLLGLGLVLRYNVVKEGPFGADSKWWVGLIVALLCLATISWAVWQSKRESAEMKEMDAELSRASGGTVPAGH
jgi:K(+)-stimulated pyrophosphate-energized sodium pump